MISWSVWKFVLFFALVSNFEVVQVAIVLGGLLLFQGGPSHALTVPGCGSLRSFSGTVDNGI